MAFPEDHVATIRPEDASDFETLAREDDEFGRGVDVVYGIKEEEGPRGGQTAVQSLRFDSTLWTDEEAENFAETWAQNNDGEILSYDAAPRQNPALEQTTMDALNRHRRLAGTGTGRRNPGENHDGGPMPSAGRGRSDATETERLLALDKMEQQEREAVEAVARGLEELGGELSKVKYRALSGARLAEEMVYETLGQPSDISGAMLITKDKEALDDAADDIQQSALGTVQSSNNLYADEGPYNAYSFVIDRGTPVEVLLITSRHAALAATASAALERGVLDRDQYGSLSKMADQADEGSSAAANSIDDIILDRDDLLERLADGRGVPVRSAARSMLTRTADMVRENPAATGLGLAGLASIAVAASQPQN